MAEADEGVSRHGAGYADYAAMYAREAESSDIHVPEMSLQPNPAEDFTAAMKIMLTSFRGSCKIFKSLKNIWYDKELQAAIKKVDGVVSYFILILGAALLMLFGANHFSTPVTTVLVIGFIIIDVFFINPLMLYMVAPKPIKVHIKEINKLSGRDKEDYEEELRKLNVSRMVQRIVDRHDESGNLIYRDRN